MTDQSKPSFVAVALSLGIIFIIPIGVIFLCWLWFHWIPATIATFLISLMYFVLWWGTFFEKPTYTREFFTGQIDHPGGSAGAAFGVAYMLNTVINQEGVWTFLLAILSIPVFGVCCSLLWGWSECNIARWRSFRSQ